MFIGLPKTKSDTKATNNFLKKSHQFTKRCLKVEWFKNCLMGKKKQRLSHTPKILIVPS